MQSHACSVCNAPSTEALPVSACRRCKRQACSKCCTSLQIYQKTGSKVQLSTVTVCEGCRSQQIQLRLFKETNKLKFAHSSAIGHRLLKFISQSSSESLAAEYKDAQTIRKSRENEQIYQRLKSKIQQQKLYTRNHLCPSLLQLYSMTASEVREEEQHEKIKNLLMALVLNKPINCLQNISQMVLFFLIFLNEQETYHIVARLYKNYVPSFIYLNRQQQIDELKSQFQQRLSDQKLLETNSGISQAYIQCYRTFTINKLNPQLSFMILQQLFGHKNELEQYFNNIMVKLIKQCKSSGYDDTVYLKLLRIPPFGIKTASKIITATKNILNVMMNQQWETKSQSIKEHPLSNSSSINPSTVVTNENSLLRKIVEKLVFQQQDLLNDVRNQYFLIIELLRKQEQQMFIQEEIFQKEKDDLIEKIVKLNNKLEDYKIQIDHVRKDKEQSERKYQQEIRVLEQRIESLLANSIQSTEEEGDTGATQKVKNKFNQQILSRSERKKILTSLSQRISFGTMIKIPPMLSFDDTTKAEIFLIDTINNRYTQLTSQIDQLTLSQCNLKRVIATNQQTNKLEIQTRKLLEIITKKEQRFVLQMHEKDKIIECYESILWHLENNIGQLPKNNQIAERVQRILEANRETDNKKKQQKTKTKDKEKGKEKEKEKQKEKQKDCLLF